MLTIKVINARNRIQVLRAKIMIDFYWNNVKVTPTVNIITDFFVFTYSLLSKVLPKTSINCPQSIITIV